MYRVYANDITINNPDTDSQNVITGTISKAVNGIDSFCFRMYITNTGWSVIEGLSTHIDVTDVITGDKDVFHGRVLTVSPAQESSGLIFKDVVCEGELAYLQDSTQFYHSLKAVPLYAVLSSVLNDHNAQTDADKQILLGSVTSSVVSRDFEWGYGKTWETIRELILDADGIGGEIRLRYEGGKRYLDYTDAVFDGGSNTVIEPGVNLISMTQTADPSAIVTDLYVYGARLGDTEERVSLPDHIYSTEARRLAGGIVAASVIFDDITDKSKLLAAAQEYFKSLRPVKKQYRFSVADMSLINGKFEAYKLGYNYRSRNKLIGIDETVRCIGMQLVIEDRTKNTLVFGDVFETLTSMTSKKSKDIKIRLDKTPELVRSVVDNQTEILRGVDGGYRYDRVDSDGKPLETIYMNSPDVNTATQALRINQNGLGFWRKDTGGGTPLTGRYDFAWTIDGTLNTAYLVAQVLTGLKINNGNGTFEVDESGKVTAKAIDIQGGSISIDTSSETTDVIRLRHNEWTMEVSPLQIKLTNDTIGGRVVLQAGAVNGYWNDQLKFNLSSDYGILNLFGTNGTRAFKFDSNDNYAYMYDSGGSATITFDVNTGTIFCNQCLQRGG